MESEEFIALHDGVCAMITLIGGGEHLWGLHKVGPHLMFPGAKYGVYLDLEKRTFYPIRVDDIWNPYILPYWPTLPARPIYPPFAGIRFLYPNLR
jgi:hypothetical protein